MLTDGKITLLQLYPDKGAPSDAEANIIAVHGLNPRNKSATDHAFDTWSTPAGRDGRLWLLPQHPPDSRISLYGDGGTAVYGQDRETLIGKANELLQVIRVERDEGVDAMDTEDALRFLHKSLIRKQLLQDRAMTTQILDELMYLPLAIAQAAAYLNQNDLSMQKYLEILRSTERTLAKSMNGEFRDNKRYRGSKIVVAITCIVSFNQIRKSNPAAAELLSFISCIEPKTIPRSLLPRLPSEEEMEHAIGALSGYAFLVDREGNKTYDMHSLVHSATRIWVRIQKRTGEIMTRALQHLKAVFPFADRANRQVWQDYMSHTFRLLEGCREYGIDERLDLLFHVGICLYIDQRFKDATNCLEEVCNWRRAHHLEQDTDRLSAEYALATVYLAQRRIEDAIEILEHVVAVRVQTLDENDVYRLASEHQLGRAYLADRLIGDAIGILEHVVAVRKQTLNKKDANRLASEHDLAKAYLADRRTNEEDHSGNDCACSTSSLENEAILDRLEDTSLMGAATTPHLIELHDPGYRSANVAASLPAKTFIQNTPKAIPKDSGGQHVLGPHLLRTETVSSASTSLSLLPAWTKSYIDCLVAELVEIVKTCSDQMTLKDIYAVLPDLLRAFALKLGYKALNSAQRDVCYAIYNEREAIRDALKDLFVSHDTTRLEVASQERAADSTQAIRRYIESLQEAEPEINELPAVEPDGTTKHDKPWSPSSPLPEEASQPLQTHNQTPPYLQKYHEFVLQAPAFHWLVTTIQREMNLTRSSPNIMEKIRASILNPLLAHYGASRSNALLESKATFEVDWNPLDFLKTNYTEPPYEALERSVTLTGSADNAQALPAGEYMSQTWPATGSHVLKTITEAIRNTISQESTCHLPDSTELHVHLKGPKIMATATGNGDSVAEIGQQLAWLGAALRPSGFAAGIAPCLPIIHTSFLGTTSTYGPPTPVAEIRCKIEFIISKPLEGGDVIPGQCWHRMFRNPVLVSGYPILTRPKRGLGVEMTLNMLSFFAGSTRAGEFDGRIFIKGFSTMMIAVHAANDLIIWHYLYNVKNEYISYLDHTIRGRETIGLIQINTARHVVGWCSDYELNAGALDAEYNVTMAGLRSPHAGCILEKVSISGGYIITAGLHFVPGAQHVPPHLTRDDYIAKLQHMRTKYVVLWDEEDKRGWLVNGTSALLHLVHTSLSYSGKGPFAASFCYDPTEVEEPTQRDPDFASRVLASVQNRKLKISIAKIEIVDEYEAVTRTPQTKEKRQHRLFQNLVEDQYHVLDQIMEYQKMAAGKAGMELKTRVRKHLEGWDFVEVATNHDIVPRVASLHALGWGWVDFIRSIGAITLFGRGFGDIMRPHVYDGMCTNWVCLPTGRFYLAATIHDMNVIREKYRAQPVPGLLWHSPQPLVKPCRCRRKTRTRFVSGKHHDPVQVFYPERAKLILPIQEPVIQNSAGAVVFGHNVTWPFRWREDGNEYVEEGHPAPMVLEPVQSIALDPKPRPDAFIRGSVRSHTAGSSSRSRESTSAAMTHASNSTAPPPSTSIESILTSFDAFTTSRVSAVADNSTLSSEQTATREDGARRRRYEKRSRGNKESWLRTGFHQVSGILKGGGRRNQLGIQRL